MKKVMTLVGVAALALAAPALADKGGKGGHGNGGGKAAKAERGTASQGGGKSARATRDGGPAKRAERGSGRADKAQRRDSGKLRQAERGGRKDKAAGAVRHGRAERGRGPDKGRETRVVKDDRQPRRVQQVRHPSGNDRSRATRYHGEGTRVVRQDRIAPTIRYAATDRSHHDRRGGCPPGLAAKNNGCLPPGQAKKLVGTRLPAPYRDERPPAYYRTWYPDNDRYLYRAGDGYLYQVSRDSRLISGFMPLYDWNSDHIDYYSVGEQYPIDTYSYYNVPAAYQPYYADNDDSYYRYGDGAIYQVDRGNGVVEAIVALLAGDLAVGSQLPAGYDTYNVPFAYRDRYEDSPDAWYRYNDGYIYEVDPQTRMVQAVIEALV